MVIFPSQVCALVTCPHAIRFDETTFQLSSGRGRHVPQSFGLSVLVRREFRSFVLSAGPRGSWAFTQTHIGFVKSRVSSCTIASCCIYELVLLLSCAACAPLSFLRALPCSVVFVQNSEAWEQNNKTYVSCDKTVWTTDVSFWVCCWTSHTECALSADGSDRVDARNGDIEFVHWRCVWGFQTLLDHVLYL